METRDATPERLVRGSNKKNKKRKGKGTNSIER